VEQVEMMSVDIWEGELIGNVLSKATGRVGRPMKRKGMGEPYREAGKFPGKAADGDANLLFGVR